jgi:hypothetical protein
MRLIDEILSKENLNQSYKLAHSKYGIYRRTGLNVSNIILSIDVLGKPNKKENRPGLVNPLAYYLKST